MKEKFRCLFAGLLIGGMLTCPALAASSFPDVDEDAEYSEAVEYLRDVGIMRGDDKGNFNPNNTVTRAEMATIICNMLGETDGIEKTGGLFTDVPESHWASGYIEKAASLEIISGYGDGRFGPDDEVTYEQALTMIIQSLNLGSEAIAAGGYPDGYIYIANEYGYTEGLTIAKGTPLKRWQVSVILHNALVF